MRFEGIPFRKMPMRLFFSDFVEFLHAFDIALPLQFATGSTGLSNERQRMKNYLLMSMSTN